MTQSIVHTKRLRVGHLLRVLWVVGLIGTGAVVSVAVAIADDAPESGSEAARQGMSQQMQVGRGADQDGGAFTLVLKRVPEDGTEEAASLLEEYWAVVEDGKELRHGRARKWNHRPYMVVEDCWYSYGKLHGVHSMWRLHRAAKSSEEAEARSGDFLAISKEESEYVNGVRHGWHRLYYANGRLEAEILYHQGETGVVRTWHRNGVQSSLRTPVDEGGMRVPTDGYLLAADVRRWVARTWSDVGRMTSESYSLHGLRNGASREWYLNGQLKLQQEFVDGKQEGERKYWRPDGTQWWVQECKEGKVVWQQNYDKQGNPEGDRFVPKD